MQHDTPHAPAVRETLERILASETFARSDRARTLLRYLVEQEQAGEADRLKGFSIAMDVFGRQAGFDPSTDAVVRVQAGRLRELLAQYFAGEGACEALRIAIPRGSYVPTYETVAAPAPAAEFADAEMPAGVEEQPRPPAQTGVAAQPILPAQVMRHVHLFWAAMTLIIAMLGFMTYRMVETPVERAAIPAVSSESVAAISVASAPETLPPVHISVADADSASARVGAVLKIALSGFDTVDFIARDYRAGGPPSAEDAIRFVFDVSPGMVQGTVVLDLQNARTGKVLLSRVLSSAETASPALDDGIADILSATIPVSGTIYAYIEQNALQSGLISCLLLNDDYYLDQKAENHEAAYRCFENLVAEDAKSPLVYSELAALHLEAVTDGYDYPAGATNEQAMAMAHRAVQMGATSPYAHRAYGFLNSGVGNSQEAIRWMRKAYELNTYDLSMAAAYGYALIFSGDYKTGTPIMQHTVEVSSAHPSWWDYGLFLGSFMLGDMDRASRATEALVTVKRSHYLAARIVAAQAAGKTPAVAQLLQELVSEFPKFATDPAAVFRNAYYPEDLTEKFVSALRTAGLGRAS